MLVHEHLIQLYEENKNLRAQSIKRTIILAAFVIVIFSAMKISQIQASLELNIAATACVTFLVFWHFKDFKHRLTLNERKVSIVLEGVQIERSAPSSKSSFFQDYLKKFNIITAAGLAAIAIFDLVLLFLFGDCMIQILKKFNLAIMTKLNLLFPLTAPMISSCTFLIYYQPIRPLVFLKKELAESRIRVSRD